MQRYQREVDMFQARLRWLMLGASAAFAVLAARVLAG
jgi:hypothetical protein